MDIFLYFSKKDMICLLEDILPAVHWFFLLTTAF